MISAAERRRSYVAGLEMSRQGWTGMLTTRGRRSGLDRVVPMGFVEGTGGDVIIGTGLERPAWAINLRSDGRCRFETMGVRRNYLAVELDPSAAVEARRQLAARYGGMAAYDGPGPAFVLHPVVVSEAAGADWPPKYPDSA